MLIPVRCFSCGKVLADKWRWYQARLAELAAGRDGDDTDDACDDAGGTAVRSVMGPAAGLLDQLGLVRMCCRRHMLSHVDLVSPPLPDAVLCASPRQGS